MGKRNTKGVISLFFTVFSIAFLIAVTISTIIAVMIGAEALPLKELRNDVLLAVFIGLVQLIWIGSDQNNRTYLTRTIIHFIILITGCTLLMIWFGWLPPSQWLAIYYAGFVAAYIVIWIAFFRINKKKWQAMNAKLDEYKRANKE